MKNSLMNIKEQYSHTLVTKETSVYDKYTITYFTLKFTIKTYLSFLKNSLLDRYSYTVDEVVLWFSFLIAFDTLYQKPLKAITSLTNSSRIFF